MRSLLIRAAFAIAFVAFPVCALAQESDVKKYSIDVTLDPVSQSASVKSTLTVLNPTDAPKRQLQFRITSKAQIIATSVAGQSVQFVTEADKRYAGLQIVRLNLPAPIVGGSSADLVVDARLQLEKRQADAMIAPGRTALLPSSCWVPVINSAFVQYGVNTAPISIRISGPQGEQALSGGIREGNGFSQALYDLPWVISGSFDPPIVSPSPTGLSFEAWIPANSVPSAKAGAVRLVGEADKIAAYYESVLGPAPRTTFRLIASDEAAGFASPSGVAFASRVFSRSTTDAETFELLADAMARAWLGQSAIRGAQPGPKANRSAGVAVVQDALPRYLATLAMGNRFGSDAERLAFDRARIALLGMGAAGGAIHLTAASPAEPAYRGIVITRGPLAIRLLEREVGREALLAGVRSAIATGRTSGWVTAQSIKESIEKAASKDLAATYSMWFETIVEPDLQLGMPTKSGAGWVSRLRNRGSGTVTVDVVATTASGKTIPMRVTIPSDDQVASELPEVRFDTSEALSTVELDPGHFVIQTDYSNDVQPNRPSASDLALRIALMLNRREFAAAETSLRQIVAADPKNPLAQAWLARALSGQNKHTEAAAAATAALASEPLPTAALAWSHVVLGRAAAAAGRHDEALGHFRAAYLEAPDVATVVASRDGLVASEKSAGKAEMAEASVGKFFAEYDRALSAGVNTAQATQLIDGNALPDFIKGLVTSTPRRWTTEIVRSEAVGADEVIADVRFTVRPSNAEPSTAPAIVRLRRFAGGWRLVAVEMLGE